jgi:hypothetical protein
MTSGITVADARTLLAGYVSPEDLNSSKFLSYLNQVRERIINSGKWRGTTFKVVFDTTRDYITLPREAEALLGIHISTAPYPIQSGWFEYLQGGPGKLDNPDNASDNARDFGTLIDMGDNFCTLNDITAAEITGVQPLSFKCLNAEDSGLGLTVNIQGLTLDGQTVYDSEGRLGINVPLSSIAEPVGYFSKVTNIQMPATFGRKQLLIGEGTPRVLSTYAPSETNPQYRRYRLPATDKTVIGTCKMRFLPLMGESEPVIPNNIGALKMGLLALNYEDVNDMATAETFWGKCFTLLDDQMREHRGSARYVPNIKFFPGNANPVPTVI